MSTLQNSADIAGANQIFGGTHNTAANQTGLTPNDSDLINFNQLIVAHLLRSATWLFPPITSWTPVVVSGGTYGYNTARAYASINTSVTSGSSAMSYTLLSGITPGTGSTYSNVVDFSRNIWVTIRINSNGGNYACPNTVFRFSIGKTSAYTGSQTSKTIGLKLAFGTANQATLYGEAYGTSLVTSASSLATLTMNNGTSDLFHQITINSQAGTIYYYVDGTLVGSLAGGPSSATAYLGTYVEFEVVNSGDSTALSVNPLDFYQPSLFVEN
jgi:hypothetical protein